MRKGSFSQQNAGASKGLLQVFLKASISQICPSYKFFLHLLTLREMQPTSAHTDM
jgi:hypothetical protein